MGRIPVPALNVTKFANARAPEIEALYSIIKLVRKRKRQNNNEDQDGDAEAVYVPRNERRRTTSYVNRKANLWKKRKRDSLKRSARFKLKEEDLNEDEVKKLSRRVRRRIELKGGSDGGYGCSGDGTTRLATHVWHAKRFTMSKKWGYYLPLGLPGKGKGSRAVLKWSNSSALLHDASYYSAVQLEGPEDSLVNVLRKVLEPSPPSVESMSETYRVELCGLCYGTAMLHKVGEVPYGSIAPITYLWCPSSSDASSATVNRDMDNNAVEKMEANNETRCLWILIHAASLNDAFNALSSACQRQKEEDGSQLVCLSRKHDFGRLDVLGSRALELLQKILHPISRVHKNAERLKDEGSFKDFQLSEAYLLANADKLPHNAVLSIEVHDPRYTPAMQNKYRPKVSSVARDGQIRQDHPMLSHKVESYVLNDLPDSELIIKSGNEDFVNMPDQTFTFAASKDEDAKKALATFSKHLYNKTLWRSQSEGLSTGPPLCENLLCNRRHQERLAFFALEEGDSQNETFEIDQGAFSNSCPIILLKNDNSKPSACGWSIILPASWIRAFWIPLTRGRARAIGLRERRWLSCDSGLPSFPYDFPDCKAYWDHMNEEAAAYEEMIASRPPSKRPPAYFLPSQWNCIERFVQRVCNVKDLSASYVTEARGGKSGSDNVVKFDVACSKNKLENPEAMRKEKSVSDNISSIQKTNSCLPGFVARTKTILKQHLRQVGGLHLLLFPEFHSIEKKNYIHLMDERQICWSLKGLNNIIVEREPCFLRVLIYAPGKGLFEDGAIVCAPKERDFELWCSRSRGWRGLEIPPNLRNLDCTQHWMDNNEMVQIADSASRPGLENLRMPVGFVTTGACCGSVPALAVAMCEGTILGQLRAEQWKDSRWRKKSEIFVLVRNVKSTAYRPALASIVIEELEDRNYK